MAITDGLLTFGTTALAAAIGAFVATLGAEFVKAYVRKSQATETARDDDLATLLRMIADLEELGVSYWSRSSTEAGEKEQRLRSKILARQRHSMELVAHLFTGVDKRECDVALVKLIEAVAGGSFGEPDRGAEPERLPSIMADCLSLSHLVKRCRRRLPRAYLA